MKRWSSALSGALVFGCGGAQAKNLKLSVISLQQVDCSECGEALAAELRNRPGVEDARFEKRTAEVLVQSQPGFDALSAAKRLATLQGFDAVLGAGKGKYLETNALPAGADAQTVVQDGADVANLNGLLVPGKYTVIDFSAIWSEPCRKIDEHMALVFKTRKDVAFRKLEIGDWSTPLAKRYLSNVGKLPYVLVYDPEGKRVRELIGVDLKQLSEAIGYEPGRP